MYFKALLGNLRPPWGHIGAFFGILGLAGPSWGYLALSAHLGGILGRPWDDLGHSSAISRSCWDHLGTSWAILRHLGPNLGHLGGIFEPSWSRSMPGPLVVLSVILDSFWGPKLNHFGIVDLGYFSKRIFRGFIVTATLASTMAIRILIQAILAITNHRSYDR